MLAERGKYIVIEGGEHVGKSTQARMLSKDIGALSIREPGGTEIGERIRAILLDPEIQKTPEAQVLLHAAQRAELSQKVIIPSLKKGKHVVSDRNWLSSAVYQGTLGVGLLDILRVNNFATGNLAPDLVIVLDAEPADVRERSKEVDDYYESMEIGFHEEVRERYKFFAEILFNNAVIIDATQAPEAVAREIREVVHDRLKA